MTIKNLMWCALLAATTASSQTLTLLDQETGKQLESVIVASESPEVSVVSDASGQCDISLFSQATNIQFRLVGYETEIRSFAQLAAENFVFFMRATGVSMSEVVVSATRWKQASKDVPAKIISISDRERLLQNPQTAADLLAISGAVFIQKSQQGGGSPMIRGFSTNRLLYAVDGVRMNTAIFRSGNLQNVISLDPFAIQNTEVFFGPGAVIYGSDAIGGVMSFSTLDPQLSESEKVSVAGKANFRYSTANQEKTAHFDVRVGGEKWASVTSFTTNNFGDLQMGSHGPEEYLRPFYVVRQNDQDVIVANPDPRLQTPSGYSQMNLMQKIRFQPNEKWDFQYAFHHAESSAYSRYDRHIRYRSNGAPRYGEWNYGPQIWTMHHFSASHNAQNLLYDQATLRLAKQYFEESRISRDIQKTVRQTRLEEVNAYSLNLDFLKKLGSRQKLFYGFEVLQNDVYSQGIDTDILTKISQQGASRYPQSGWFSAAAYLSHQLQIDPKLLLQSGLRYNLFGLDAQFDTTFYPFPYTSAQWSRGAVVGSLGAVYRPAKDWVWSANFSTGFRSPNVDDAGKVFDSEPGRVLVPNPDLQAEYAYNAELGLAKMFGRSLKIDVTGYYTLLDKALVRRDFLLNGRDSILYDGTLSRVQAIQNAANARVYGIQFGLEARLGAGFRFSTDFNYQVGKEENDDGTTAPSRHAPPMFGVARLTYRVAGLEMQLYTQFSGERKFEKLPPEEQGKPEIYAKDANGKPYSPSWQTLNFKAAYKISEKVFLTAGVENLTDVRYRPYSSGIVAPGRNVIIAVQANF